MKTLKNAMTIGVDDPLKNGGVSAKKALVSPRNAAVSGRNAPLFRLLGVEAKIRFFPIL
ncbi:MAG: hypothetical protein OXN25_19440 [Candidatus Poribacteria bacterium]|nr:hypothetical protein [Candidatus Poribacteria bacterium]